MIMTPDFSSEILLQIMISVDRTRMEKFVMNVHRRITFPSQFSKIVVFVANLEKASIDKPEFPRLAWF